MKNEEKSEISFNKSPNARPASFWQRFLAVIVDNIILGTVSSLIIYPIIMAVGLSDFASKGTLNMSSSEDMISLVILAVVYLIIPLFALFYYGYFYSKKGASPGKMIFNLKVLDNDSGEHIGYAKVFLRGIGYIVATLPLYIGLIMAGIRQDKRGLHDIIAGTRVVKID